MSATLVILLSHAGRLFLPSILKHDSKFLEQESLKQQTISGIAVDLSTDPRIFLLANSYYLITRCNVPVAKPTSLAIHNTPFPCLRHFCRIRTHWVPHSNKSDSDTRICGEGENHYEFRYRQTLFRRQRFATKIE